MRAEIRFLGAEAQRALGNVAAIGNEAKGFQNLAKALASACELAGLVTGLNAPVKALATAALNTKRFYRIALKPLQLLDLWVGETPFWKEPGATFLSKVQVVTKTANNCIKIVDSPVFAALRSATWLPLSVALMQARFGLSMVNSALKVHKLFKRFQSLKGVITETKAIHARWKAFKQRLDANDYSALENEHKKQVSDLKSKISGWIESFQKKNQPESASLARRALETFCQTLAKLEGGEDNFRKAHKQLQQMLDDGAKGQDEKEIWKKIAEVEFENDKLENVSVEAVRELLLTRELRKPIASFSEELRELIIYLYNLEDASFAYVLSKTHAKQGHREALEQLYNSKLAHEESALARHLHAAKGTLIDGGRQVTQIALSALGLGLSFVNPVSAGVVLLVYECASGLFGLTKFLCHGRRKDIHQNP